LDPLAQNGKQIGICHNATANIFPFRSYQQKYNQYDRYNRYQRSADGAPNEFLYGLIDKELFRLGDTAHTITVFHSGEAFIAKWEAGLYDIIVLDIYMDGMTGIDIAYKIRERDDRVGLVFCTSSNEFASESFEVDAKHYLRKPVTPEGVSKMLSRFDFSETEKNRIVTLPDGYEVKLRRIMYAIYENHTVTVSLKNEPSHRFRTSYTEAEKNLLPHGYFFSPTKGIILNFYEVKHFSDGVFVMNDDMIFHVVRRKLKEAKDAYTKFLFDKMSREVDR